MARYSDVIKGLEILRKYDIDGYDNKYGVVGQWGKMYAGTKASMIKLSTYDKNRLYQLGWYIDNDLWQINA